MKKIHIYILSVLIFILCLSFVINGSPKTCTRASFQPLENETNLTRSMNNHIITNYQDNRETRQNSDTHDNLYKKQLQDNTTNNTRQNQSNQNRTTEAKTLTNQEQTQRNNSNQNQIKSDSTLSNQAMNQKESGTNNLKNNQTANNSNSQNNITNKTPTQNNNQNKNVGNQNSNNNTLNNNSNADFNKNQNAVNQPTTQPAPLDVNKPIVTDIESTNTPSNSNNANNNTTNGNVNDSETIVDKESGKTENTQTENEFTPKIYIRYFEMTNCPECFDEVEQNLTNNTTMFSPFSDVNKFFQSINYQFEKVNSYLQNNNAKTTRSTKDNVEIINFNF